MKGMIDFMFTRTTPGVPLIVQIKIPFVANQQFIKTLGTMVSCEIMPTVALNWMNCAYPNHQSIEQKTFT